METSIDMAYMTFLLFLVVVERRVIGEKTIKTLVKQQELISKQEHNWCPLFTSILSNGLISKSEL